MKRFRKLIPILFSALFLAPVVSVRVSAMQGLDARRKKAALVAAVGYIQSLAWHLKSGQLMWEQGQTFGSYTLSRKMPRRSLTAHVGAAER